MRKTLLIVALAVVFAAAFTLAVVMPVQAAGGGGCTLPPGCSYACSCDGTPLVCCNGSCKPDLSGCWSCPQIYNC